MVGRHAPQSSVRHTDVLERVASSLARKWIQSFAAATNHVEHVGNSQASRTTCRICQLELTQTARNRPEKPVQRRQKETRKRERKKGRTNEVLDDSEVFLRLRDQALQPTEGVRPFLQKPNIWPRVFSDAQQDPKRENSKIQKERLVACVTLSCMCYA